MKIIAKTKEGFIIEASKHDVSEILNSVLGKTIDKDKIEVGQKIPAIDYASTIKKIKSLKSDFYYKQLISKHDDFFEVIRGLKQCVREAEKI